MSRETSMKESTKEISFNIKNGQVQQTTQYIFLPVESSFRFFPRNLCFAKHNIRGVKRLILEKQRKEKRKISNINDNVYKN